MWYVMRSSILFMWLTHRGRKCFELDRRVFRRLFSYYPEEKLLDRAILAEALRGDEITKSDLMDEAEKAFIPWQMFLLGWNRLVEELANIEENRRDKIRVGRVSTRGSRGDSVPNRLFDRYIRAQNFLVSHGTYSRNAFAGSLRGVSVADAVGILASSFAIDINYFWGRGTKETAFSYLLARVELGQINVALGTSDSRLMPRSENHKALYKNISGFCLRDELVPFIFETMNMAVDEEPVGRQIYTLVYLLALVGLDVYTLTRDWRPDSVSRGRGTTYLRHAHEIASEFLMPSKELEIYRGTRITHEIVQRIGARHKLTPSAVLYRLRKERYITAEEEVALAPPEYKGRPGGRTAHIENAVRKLNGPLVVASVNTGVTTGSVSQNQAQYILFGRIRRKTWREYRARTGV